jgi:hypothetical protein
LLGVVVFGDVIHISPATLALQAAGIVALVAGVILVARAPALSSLRLRGPILSRPGRADRVPAPAEPEEVVLTVGSWRCRARKMSDWIRLPVRKSEPAE